jgi:hypothetical protein
MARLCELPLATRELLMGSYVRGFARSLLAGIHRLAACITLGMRGSYTLVCVTLRGLFDLDPGLRLVRALGSDALEAQFPGPSCGLNLVILFFQLPAELALPVQLFVEGLFKGSKRLVGLVQAAGVHPEEIVTPFGTRGMRQRGIGIRL